MEDALTGQMTLLKEEHDPEVDILVEKARRKRKRNKASFPQLGLPRGIPLPKGIPPTASPTAGNEKHMVEIDTDGVETDRHHETGSLHLGLQMYRRLGIEEILESVGLSSDTCQLTIAMILNRFICPTSEHAMPDWFEQTALSDIRVFDFSIRKGGRAEPPWHPAKTPMDSDYFLGQNEI